MQTILAINLKETMKNRSVTVTDLAREAQVKPSFIYDILNGKSANPSTARLLQISQALQVGLTELLGVEQQRQASHGDDYILITRRLTVSDGTAEDQSVDGETQDDYASKVTETEGDPYYFRQSWIKNRLNARPDDLRLITVEGDSMEPTLCQSDIVLIDITKKTASPPGVFVLFDGLGLVVKRLEFISHSKPPSIRIMSDNTQYTPYERTVSETEIVGRVVWFAREI